MNLLIVTLEGFNEIEMNNFIVVIEKSKIFDKINFYNPKLKKVSGMFGYSQIETINDIDHSDYEAIYIPGGKAAVALRQDKISLDLINQFLKDQKMVIAICDAPNALYETNLIDNFRYTSYPVANLKSSPKREKDKTIVIDDNLITGRSAYYTIDLGLEIIKILTNKELAEQILKDLKGLLYN